MGFKATKGLILLGIIAAGLPAGFFLRSTFQTQVDRAAAAMSMFETYCAPFSQGKIIPPSPDLVRISALGKHAWADQRSRLTVSYSPKNCTVSDVLDPMSNKDRTALTNQVVAMVEREYPQLQPYHDISMDSWDEFLLWDEYLVGDPRRNGIMLVRFSPSGESSATTLSFYLPSNRALSDVTLESLNNHYL
jgi:hypothetical protein